MIKNNERELKKNWCDSTLDMEEFREWDVKKQLEAISDFAKSYHSFQKKLEEDRQVK